MRVRNSPEYKERIKALLEARKERREKRIRERTQLELFEDETVMLDNILLDESKEVKGIQIKKRQVRK